MTRDKNGFMVASEEELESVLPEDERESSEKQEEEKIPEDNEYDNPEKATRFGKTAPRINKRAIIMTTLAAVSVVMIGSTILSGKEKEKEKSAEGKAPEVAVPNFGDYRSRAYSPDEESVPMDMPEEIQEKRPPVSPPSQKTVYVRPEEPVKQGPNQRVPPKQSSMTEAEIAALSSSMIPKVEGILIGRQTQSGQQPSSPIAKGLSGVLSPEEYFQQRFASASQMPGASLPQHVTPSTPSGSQSTYRDQNMQSDKIAFHEDGKDEQPSGHFIGENTLWMGTIIPGVLITGINTDLPGDIQARITENIYDSMTGKKLLVPQGTILIASYNSSVSFAQSRVQIAWHTMIRPDGYQISLGNMNAVDAKGQAGISGWVDEHMWQYLKAAGVISLFSLINSEFSYTNSVASNETLQNLIAQNQALVNQFGNRTIDRVLDIQPTIRIKNGTKINIMLNKNIYIPPLDDYPVAGKYVRY